MEKERFLELARNFTSLTKEETHDLDALQKEYPYSQVIHNLASRGAQDHKLPTSKELLSISAVYSNDRSVLRDIITTPRTERNTELQNTDVDVEQKKIEVKVAEITIPSEGSIDAEKSAEVQSDKPLEVSTTEASIGIPSGHSNGAVADEVLHDLERLRELKHNFELTVESLSHPQKTPPIQKKKNVPAAEVAPEPEGEVLLEEIKVKKKFVPETPRQKEQIDIIDQFIKKAPSIKKPLPHADGHDLAEKNFTLTENVVSETLVEILLRQGKKDKAIEVLKKLIWKFPQKKAIFAAQIDELKK